MQRWSDPDGGPFGRNPFGVTVDEERTDAGVTLPAVVRAGWWRGTDRQDAGEFFRARISDSTEECRGQEERPEPAGQSGHDPEAPGALPSGSSGRRTGPVSCWRRRSGAVPSSRTAVTDAALDLPPLPITDRDPAEGGMGLQMVGRLAEDHGWSVSGGRTTVGALLAPR
jgi:hypothetical protein